GDGWSARSILHLRGLRNRFFTGHSQLVTHHSQPSKSDELKRASDEDASPERAQRVEGPLFRWTLKYKSDELNHVDSRSSIKSPGEGRSVGKPSPASNGDTHPACSEASLRASRGHLRERAQRVTQFACRVPQRGQECRSAFARHSSLATRHFF